MKKITFQKKDLTIVANMFFPENYNSQKKYPAIIVGHPTGGVKEQTAGLYAQNLAKAGFITLAFDASFQGESSGKPRHLESPHERITDFNAAVDFLNTTDDIDSSKIGVLGICAGGGYAIKATETDTRIKAIATISMTDIGHLFYEGVNKELLDSATTTLDAVANQKTKEAQGENIAYIDILATKKEEITEQAPQLFKQAYEYYREKHAHPNAPAKMTLTSLGEIFNFRAVNEQISMISPRPILLIAGSSADTLFFSKKAYDLAKDPKELFIIENATHIDLYYKQPYVDKIANKLIDFFTINL